jgi:hypothetical protein
LDIQKSSVANTHIAYIEHLKGAGALEKIAVQ